MTSETSDDEQMTSEVCRFCDGWLSYKELMNNHCCGCSALMCKGCTLKCDICKLKGCNPNWNHGGCEFIYECNCGSVLCAYCVTTPVYQDGIYYCAACTEERQLASQLSDIELKSK